MIDSHCHLEIKQFNKDRTEVVGRAKAAGVRAVINPASDFASNAKIAALASENAGFVFACVGLDPISALRDEKETDGIIAFALKNEKLIVAVGEIGLDYHWSQEKERQKANFARFIELANELGKPIIVHSRKSMKDALAMIRKAEHGGVLHFFTGTKTEAKAAADAGFFVSIAASGTQSESLIKSVDIEYLLAETDSPFLTPKGGGRNEPANVRFAYEAIARANELGFEEAERTVDRNAERLFKIRL